MVEVRGRVRLLGLCLGLAVPVMAIADMVPAKPGLERLVFLRHGEKPATSLGQLTCQGLNRSLALAPVLVGKYGRPDYIFAPDPRQEKSDPHHSAYDYVRPLATIEPTAIQLGMPVNTQYNTAHSDELRLHLGDSHYHQSLVFIAWEHHLIEQMVRNLVTQWGGDAATVPEWTDGDYDSLYVVDITHSNGKASVRFHRDTEGLDGQDTLCPAQHIKAPSVTQP